MTYIPLELGSQDKPISKTEDLNEYSLHAKFYGIATHYCLEMIKAFNVDSLDYAINLLRNRYSSYLNEEDFISIKKRILNLIINYKILFMCTDRNFFRTKYQGFNFQFQYTLYNLVYNSLTALHPKFLHKGHVVLLYNSLTALHPKFLHKVLFVLPGRARRQGEPGRFSKLFL